MSRLEWDNAGEKYYESGCDRGVLYLKVSGAYPAGVAWNGLTGVSENPSGAEPTKLYADNIVYAAPISQEEFSATVESYTYPDEFGECIGQAEIATGVSIGQQPRKSFGMTYRTLIGNDETSEAGYKLHIIYGATAKPSSRDRKTDGENPEAITFSHELSTVPEKVTGHKPTAYIEIDSRTVDGDKLKALENILYGTESAEAYLPLPDAISTLMHAQG